MLKVGIVGFGGMGHFHASVYGKRSDVELVAIADTDAAQLRGQSLAINIGVGQAFDMSTVRCYASANAMFAKESLDLISICLPTDHHVPCAVKALKKGMHVLCEKPMSRTLRQADALIAAQRASGCSLMVAQCLRFWPCYEKLEEVHRSGVYGRLLMLTMRRVSGLPGWQVGKPSWFMDGRRSGGCLLDMHIHDTDFVNHLLGTPVAVTTLGRTCMTGAIDNSITQYFYANGPVVSAEASWSYCGGFNMAFSAEFEQATLEMGYRDGDLRLMRPGRELVKVELPADDGYAREIDYFIGCIRNVTAPARCLPESTRETMRIAMAEERSALAGGKRVKL